MSYPLHFTIAICTLSVLPALTPSFTGSEILASGFLIGNDVIRMHNRRAVMPNTKDLAVKGAEIVKKLLKGATIIDSTSRRRLYMKHGTFQTAVDDFKRIKPEPTTVEKSHKYHWESNIVSGKVGDRFIVVERKGNMGSPTLTILRNNNGIYDQADAIIYTKFAPKTRSE